jgi:hypothetical protein
MTTRDSSLAVIGPLAEVAVLTSLVNVALSINRKRFSACFPTCRNVLHTTGLTAEERFHE